MLILAIDTTGFSASLALVKNGREVLYNKTISNFVPGKKWEEFPYILPWRHQSPLLNNLEKVFKNNKIHWNRIDAIAVSSGSGIFNCILIGTSIAKTLSVVYKKPLIEVDHILAHIYSTWIERNPENFQFPILAFSASGSHSGFFLLKSKKRCEVIYDAVPQEDKKGVKTFIGIGKVFYEVGKKLGVLASSDSDVKKLLETASRGNHHKFNFKKYYSGQIFDLNFSDFTSSIERFLKKEKIKKSKKGLLIKDVAASFQESITEILVNKILTLAKIKKVKEIHITGGISEDEYLKRRLKEKIGKGKLSFILRYPFKKHYRLDNAAMIGALAYYQQKYKIKFINFNPKITK